MISRAEAKRRKRQSARDKARHCEKLEDQEQERRRRQSSRDRARYHARHVESVWSSSLLATSTRTLHPASDFPAQPVQTPLRRSEGEALDSEEMGPPLIEKNFFGEFCEQTAKMYNEPKMADATISIGTIDFPIHRFVLCLQSKYFADALNGAYMEAKTQTLKCPSHKEHAYLRLLRYLYTGDYDEEPSSLVTAADVDELLKHPQVYFLADSFDLSNLKTVALEKFESKLQQLWLSERFVDCIVEGYCNTPSENEDGMRAAIIHTCIMHVSDLLPTKAFLALLEKGGDFVVDLTRALALNKGQSKGRAYSEDF